MPEPQSKISELAPSPTLQPLWRGLKPQVSTTVALAIVILVTAATFSFVSTFDFVTWDDNIHVYCNPHFRYWNIGEAAYFWQHPYESLYVPLSYTVFVILSLIAHRPTGFQQVTVTGAHVDPHVFHFANLVLHLLNTTLVFFLLRRMTRKELPSVIGTLIFAIHPLQVESVAWISELRGLLSAAFGLTSIHLYLNYIVCQERGRKVASRAAYVASLISLIFALLSKPSAVSIGLIIVPIAVWGYRRPWKIVLAEVLPYIIAGIALILVTSHVQGTPRGQRVAVWLRPFVACDALDFYICKFVLPLRLAIDYGRKPTWVLSHWWAYADWIAPATIAYYAFRVRNQAPYLTLGLSVTLAALLPVLGLTPFVYQSISTVADRYTYFALIGPAMIISYGVSLLPKPNQSALLGIAATWLFALCILSFKQTFVWRSSESLLWNAVTVNPHSATSQNNLALLLASKSETLLAIKHYQFAVDDEPTYTLYENNLGTAYYQYGDIAAALLHYDRAEKLDPRDPLVRYNLGVLYLEHNQVATGISELQTSLRLDPAEYLSAMRLGDYYVKQKDYSEAVAVYSIGTQGRPDIEPLWRGLGMALCGANRPTDAVYPLQTALELDPTDQTVKDLLSTIRADSTAGGG